MEKKSAIKPAFVFLFVVALTVLLFASCAKEPQQTHTHSFGEWSVKKEATCVEEGIRQRFCSCGEIQEDSIPVTSHTVVDDPLIPATCTEEGKTAGKHCSVCGLIIEEQTAIPATGHDYQEAIVVKATGTVQGTKEYTCANCGDKYQEQYAATRLSSEELYNLAEKAVVEITTYKKNGDGLSLGSGFIISADGQIVTNFHVIDEAYKINVAYNNRTYTVTDVLAYSEDIDLAILKISASGLNFVEMNEDLQQGGGDAFAVGSSEGYTLSFSTGTIASPDRVFGDVHYIQHSSPISHGNSGGPLFNAYGEVIGVNTSTDIDGQNLNFAIRVSELKRLPEDKPMTMEQFYAEEGPFFEIELGEKIVTEKESNDDFTQAQLITSNGTTVDGAVSGEDDWDFYKITVGAGQSLWVIAVPDMSIDASGILTGIISDSLDLLDSGTKTTLDWGDVIIALYENETSSPVTVYYVMTYYDDYYFKTATADYNVFFYVK